MIIQMKRYYIQTIKKEFIQMEIKNNDGYNRMNQIKLDIREERANRVEPISKKLTLLSAVIVTFILIATFVSLTVIPSPDDNGETFLRFLLRNMNLIA